MTRSNVYAYRPGCILGPVAYLPTGNDRFNVYAGTDTVADLASGTDVLVVSAGATANVTLGGNFTALATTSNSGIANLTGAGRTVNLAAAMAADGLSVGVVSSACEMAAMPRLRTAVAAVASMGPEDREG